MSLLDRGPESASGPRRGVNPPTPAHRARGSDVTAPQGLLGSDDRRRGLGRGQEQRTSGGTVLPRAFPGEAVVLRRRRRPLLGELKGPLERTPVEEQTGGVCSEDGRRGADGRQVLLRGNRVPRRLAHRGASLGQVLEPTMLFAEDVAMIAEREVREPQQPVAPDEACQVKG